jgi:hypothetical protein
MARYPLASWVLTMARMDRATELDKFDRDREIKYARDNIKISFSDTNDHSIYIMCAVCKKVFHVDDPERWGKIEGGGIWKCNDHKNTVLMQSTHTIPFEKNITKYKRVGSPDIYAVQYNDTGKIITTAEPEKHQEDIREMDNKGKFGLPKLRYRSPQFW